jgi:predicted 2-oxoglutarate/Fe(II)-dependent dioxygenase YbiX
LNEASSLLACDSSNVRPRILATWDSFIPRSLAKNFAVGGHFYRHRDNVNIGAQHRRFAVTINLNKDYDGCDLVLPEFGRRTYRAPYGGAVVFSCGALHQVTPVTRGRRYAFLAFLYGEADAALREANNAKLHQSAAQYAVESDRLFPDDVPSRERRAM